MKALKILKVTIAAILALILTSIPYVIGILLSYFFNIDNNVITIISIIMHVLFLVLIFTNAGIRSHNAKKMNKKKPSEVFQELVSIKDLNTKTEEIQEKLIKNYKKEYYTAIISHIFIFSTMLMFGLNYHVLTRLSEEFDYNAVYITVISVPAMVILFIAFILIFGALLKLFNIQSIKNNHDLYPNLSKLIIEEFKKEGINKDIIINITNDCNAGIYEIKDKIGINISYIILKFLNTEEIKSIIYHEIAHYKNKDTLKSAEMYKYINRLDYLSPSTFNVLTPNLGKIAIESEMLKEATNVLFEHKADDLVLEKGLAPAYSDASFKIFGLDLSFQNVSYLDYYIYFTKELKYDEELLNIKLNLIKSYYYKHLDFFTYASKNYLSPIIITHPTIKQRLEKFDTGKVIDKELILNTEFDEDINNYVKELNNDLQKDQVALNNLKDQNQYYATKYLIEKKKLIENNYDEDVNELSAIAQDSLNFADLEFSKELFKRILEKDPNNLIAKFYLGLLLFKNDLDSSCLSYLIDVEKDNSEIGAEAHGLLLEYYTYMGMKDEKEELKKHSFKKMDDTYNLNLRFNYGEKLLPYTNQEVIQKIIEIAKESDEILHIVVGTKKKKDIENHILVFYIKLTDDNQNPWEKTLNKIRAYVNTVSSNFKLYPFYFQIIHNRYKKKEFHIYDAKKDNQ